MNEMTVEDFNGVGNEEAVFALCNGGGARFAGPGTSLCFVWNFHSNWLLIL